MLSPGCHGGGAKKGEATGNLCVTWTKRYLQMEDVILYILVLVLSSFSFLFNEFWDKVWGFTLLNEVQEISPVVSRYCITISNKTQNQLRFRGEEIPGLFSHPVGQCGMKTSGDRVRQVVRRTCGFTVKRTQLIKG